MQDDKVTIEQLRQVCLLGERWSFITCRFLRSAIDLRDREIEVVFIDKGSSPLALALACIRRLKFILLWDLLISNFHSFHATKAYGASDDELDALLPRSDDAVVVVCGCNRILRSKHLTGRQVINYHNSVLPSHRGVAAVNWALYYGDPVGFTFHRVESSIDTGEYMLQRVISSPAHPDAFDIARRVDCAAAKSLKQLLEVLEGFRRRSISPLVSRESYHSRSDYRNVIAIDHSDGAEILRKEAAFGRLTISIGGKVMTLRRAIPLELMTPFSRTMCLSVTNCAGVVVGVPVFSNPLFFLWSCRSKTANALRRLARV